MRARRPRIALAATAAVLALLVFAGAALAHGGSTGPMAGMSAEEHAAMMSGRGQSTATGHSSAMPGMSAEEHAAMSAGDEGGATGRPVGLLIGGFVAVNLLVLLVAAIARRRGPAAKRRAAKARVRSAAGRPTAAAASARRP